MSSQLRTLLAVGLVALVAAGWYRYSVTQADAPAPLKPVDIVFVTGGSGPYWQIAANGARAAAKDLGANIMIEMPPESESLSEQTEILEGIDEAAVDGIALSPLDAAGQTALVDKLAEETFVVTFDSDAPDSKRIGYVGTSNFAAGRVCARLTREALPDGGKVAVILANTTKDNLQDRKGGFQQTLAQLAAVDAGGDASGDAKEIAVVEFLIDGGDNDKCAELIQETLAAHPDLACFIGMNARHGPILYKVLKESDKLGTIKIIAFDDAEETLAGIEDGNIYASVVQDTYRYGYESVRMLCALARGDEMQQPIAASTYSVEAKPIRQEDLKEYRAKLKGRLKGTGGEKDAA